MSANRVQKAVSVVLPFVECEHDVVSVIDDVHHSLGKQLNSLEIIAVEGRSRDNTWLVLKELRPVYPEMKLYRLSKPGITGDCSVRGLMEATGKLIFHMEPHSPWSSQIFWEMARICQDSGKCPVYCCRTPADSTENKVYQNIIHRHIKRTWKSTVPDPAFPVQLIPKRAMEKIHVMVPDQAEAPGLTTYLLFNFFKQPTICFHPEKKSEEQPSRVSNPAMFASLSTVRRSLRQMQQLRRQLDEIQGIMDFQ